MKKLRVKPLLAASLLVLLAVYAQAATGKKIGTNPFGGSAEGVGVTIHVVDTAIQNDVPDGVAGAPTWRVVNADTGFTPMAADTTIKIFYAGSDGDTATVTVLGIRPKNTRAKSDTFRVWTETIKVDGGDTVATDSSFHAFNQVWVDSGKTAEIRVWPAGQSNTLKRLRTIPARRITSPIAHWIFGGDDHPGISSIQVGLSSDRSTVLDTLVWSQSRTLVKRDTLVGDSDKDTTAIMSIGKLSAMSLAWTRTVKQGSLSGGNYLVTIVPQVSVDATNWQSLDTTGVAVFTATSSASATTTYHVLYNTAGDTVLSRGRNIARIDAARYLRFLSTQDVDSYIAGVSDSTFLVAGTNREYVGEGPGVAYELRVYPNIENAIQYNNDYYVLDNGYVSNATGSKTFSWPNGLRLPARTYLAVVALGDVDGMAGYVTITGERNAGR